MFSTDFIFRQQENLVDNKKILLTTRNVRLDSGHYATKYYLVNGWQQCPPRFKLHSLAQKMGWQHQIIHKCHIKLTWKFG